ncbi:kinesin light chain 1 [Paraphoma chrysanthemicola]|uniref:Kinesin light chain 1 n=1 Tax=Paraphoma chrysanthemicola TaxID=798071 RepID=A0A8K0QY22_9PLEO|nr:kinesin light chain 1 [Paraphoma chrysanthemicola]
MRLLHRLPSGSFELSRFDDDHPPPYAILSHTWHVDQEVTQRDILAGTGTDKAGYDKIVFCGAQAVADGLEYFWVDSCCIDQSSSVELSTAINSMFRWYQRASKCYVYLSDVSADGPQDDQTWLDAFRRGRWFTRGWTLQELIAPSSVDFFSKEHTRLGSKVSLEQEIHKVTKIPVEVLRGQRLGERTVEERMSWAAHRITTVKEDKVYCLLGIFGVFLPLIYGEGVNYATVRLNEEIKKRQAGKGFQDLRQVSVFALLPFPRNERFVGRDDELHLLEQSLLTPSTHQRMIIYGLGGSGKSALALEFAYRTMTRYTKHFVFWVPAISQESFELAYKDIGIRLCLPGIDDDNADVKKLVKEALNAGTVGEWLMIVDNADDPAVILGTLTDDTGTARLDDYLSRSDKGRILFTSRNRKVAADLTLSRVLALEDMGKDEAKELLARRVMKQELVSDKIAIGELLELLTYLPLAIVQAAAFINSNGVSASDYLSLFRHASQEAELLSEEFEDAGRYRELDSTIARTWHISFEQIRTQDPLAAEYLSMIACFDRTNIPKSLLAFKGSLVQQVKAIGTLTGYAFITEHQQSVQGASEERLFDMHSLVHMASIWWLESHGEQATWASAAVERLLELVPLDGYERNASWTRYLPHAIHAAGIAVHGKEHETARATLFDHVGRCQIPLAQFSAAEASHRSALALRSSIFGPDHANTLVSKSQLAYALSAQGQYDTAEAMIRQIIVQSEKILGPDHSVTLFSMNTLATILTTLDKLEESEVVTRETLARNTKVYGDKHRNTLTNLNGLAILLRKQGKLDEAEAVVRQTLAQREQLFGPDHPDTLYSVTNLTKILLTYENYTKYEEAMSIGRQAMARREKVLGPDHMDTLSGLMDFATALHHTGIRYQDKRKLDEAEALTRQALTRYREVFGHEHHSTLAVLRHLIQQLQMSDKGAKAEVLARESLAVHEKALGCDHPDTCMSVYLLAYTLARLCLFDEARALFERACAQHSTIFGEEDAKTRSCRNEYAGMLAFQQQYSPKMTSKPSEGGKKMGTGKTSAIARQLAKLGIGNSRLSAR